VLLAAVVAAAGIGEQFAYIQIKVVISTLLRMYRLRPLSATLPEPNYKAMVVGPLAPTTMVRVEQRAV
jgi:hypothetical protein